MTTSDALHCQDATGPAPNTPNRQLVMHLARWMQAPKEFLPGAPVYMMEKTFIAIVAA